MAKLKDNLITKNVDTDVAECLTEAIMQKLEGSMMETFQSVARHVKIALYEALREILSPQASQSIFTDVVDTRDQSVPHTIILLGVNGIIKTNNVVEFSRYITSMGYTVMMSPLLGLRKLAKRLPLMLDPLQDVDLFIGEDDPADAVDSAVLAATKDNKDVLIIDTAAVKLSTPKKMLALANIMKGKN